MRKFKQFFIFTVFLLLLLLPVGCGNTNIPLFPWDNSEDSQSTLHANPKFRRHAVLTEGTKNIYTLALPELEAGLPYNNLYPFGDKILIVGEYYYETGETPTEREGDDTIPLYTFLVYDPWADHVTAELLPQQINCSCYAILNEQLLVIDYEDFELTLYDSSLKKIHSYRAAKLLKDRYLSFFAAPEKNTAYACDYDGHLYFLEMNGDNFNYKEIRLPFYNPNIATVSPDGKTPYAFGIDPDTLKYTLSRLDASTYKTVWSTQTQNFFFGACSDDSVLVQQDLSQNFWTYFIKDQARHFYLPDTADVLLTENDTFLLRQEIYRYHQEADSASTLFQYGKYNSRGKYQSGFSYEINYQDENPVHLSPTGVYLPDCGCYFILKYDYECHASLLIWDTTVNDALGESLVCAGSQDELSAKVAALPIEDDPNGKPDISYGYLVTAVPDPDHYDWGELAPINARANQLEKEYGISIYLGPEIPDQIDIYHTDQCLNAEILSEALTRLERVLRCYPKNFFSQLCFGDLKGIRFYLCGDLSGDMENMVNDPSGFVNEINSHMVMVLDTQYSFDWDYTINHELSHMIDRRLEFRSQYVEDSIYSEEKWKSYNPAGCKYLESYGGYEDSKTYWKYSDYFIDSYGTTFPTEDRAEIFGRAMADYLTEEQENFYFRESSPIRAKLDYYCKSIRNGFNTRDWSSVMAWEAVLE